MKYCSLSLIKYHKDSSKEFEFEIDNSYFVISRLILKGCDGSVVVRR